MGDAKSRQRSEDGSHGNGRVNIEMAPVLDSGLAGTVMKQERSNSIFISFLVLPQQPSFPPKITLRRTHMY